MAENIQKKLQLLRNKETFTSRADAAKGLTAKLTETNIEEGLPAIAIYAEGDKTGVLFGVAGRGGSYQIFEGSTVDENGEISVPESVQAAINAAVKDVDIKSVLADLDFDTTGNEGEVVTKVTQEDGQIAVEYGKVTATSVETEKIDGTDDTVEVKGTNVATQIAEIAKTIKGVKDDAEDAKANAAKYKVRKITEELPENVREIYQVVSYVGEEAEDTDYTQVGENIIIYKDGQLINVEPTANEHGETTAVKFTYSLGDGKENKVVTIDLGKAIFESEMGDGIEVVDSKITIKLDTDNEDEFLSVGAGGLKLAGVQAKIDTKVDELKKELTEGEGSLKSQVDVNKAAIETLNGADTEAGSVAKAVKDAVEAVEAKVKANTDAIKAGADAIAALDVTDTAIDGQFVTAVSQEDGKITVTRSGVAAEKVTLAEIKDSTNEAIKLNATNVQAGIAELFSKMLDNENVTAETFKKLIEVLGASVLADDKETIDYSNPGGILAEAKSFTDADKILADAIQEIQNANTIDCGTY